MNNLKIHLSPEELALAAEQTVRQKNLPEAVRNHLDNCDSCKYELMTLIELQEGNLDHKTVILQRKSSVWFAAAAVILVLLAVGVWWTMNNSPEQSLPLDQITQQLEPSDETTNAEVVVKDVFAKEENGQPTLNNDDQLALAAFAPNLEMERLTKRYQTEMRNAGNAEVQVDSKMDSLHFSWNAEGMLIFELYNNEGELLEEIETTARSASFEVKQAGLYYFKLINEDFDLLWCGKTNYR
ncbi:MAG: hypothetical protein PF694_03825 [Bacteroidetes bacterium]|jgi:hypothetical protein|nr:hypothetical protein [Bacteroidota bacterium]